LRSLTCRQISKQPGRERSNPRFALLLVCGSIQERHGQRLTAKQFQDCSIQNRYPHDAPF
jgi:hypothetical protein